jgi:predicted alpha/beta hydrolase family esterase
MQPTIYLIPRWGGKIHSDWYDWFGAEIMERYGLSVIVLDMPNWNQPDVEESVNYLLSQISHIDKLTYFIGHSVGCQVVIRYLIARLGQDRTLEIGGILLVAAWFMVDRPWDTINPWIANKGLDYRSLAERVRSRKVVLSDNDPFTPNYAENKKLWVDRINASVTVYPQRAHFNSKAEPGVIEGFSEMIGKEYH